MGKRQKLTGFWYGDGYANQMWVEFPLPHYEHRIETRLIEYKGRLWLHTVDYNGFTGKSTGRYEMLFDTCEPMDDIPF